MKKSATKSCGGRMLVVEDNVDSREILSKLLRRSGFEVSSAADGESGYAAALAQAPDLIITDINMPGMDGIEFLKKIRREGQFARTAVLVVTAFGGDAAQDAIAAGADAAAAKPFEFEGFVDTVQSLIFTRKKTAGETELGRQSGAVRNIQ